MAQGKIKVKNPGVQTKKGKHQKKSQLGPKKGGI